MNPILVIDDEQQLLKLICMLLTKKGHNVDTANDGIEGIEKLSKNKYSLVVCDLNMPRLDGIGVIKKARSSGNETPFIFFTGHGNETLMIESLKYGARGFINKPHFDNLENLIDEILNSK
ncbi:MAG: hypothetical protein CME60_14405 [Halobacteriovoraceae bacterium]|nr:hypothetical protein [Halobacteriovoraceae bacterium]